MTSPPSRTPEQDSDNTSGHDDTAQQPPTKASDQTAHPKLPPSENQSTRGHKRPSIPKPLMHGATIHRKSAQGKAPAQTQNKAQGKATTDKGAPTASKAFQAPSAHAKRQVKKRPEKAAKKIPLKKKQKTHSQTQTSILTAPFAFAFSKSLKAIIIFFQLKLYYWKNHPIHGCLTLALLAVLLLLVKTGAGVYHQLIYEPIPEQTIASVLEASRFTRHYSATKVKQRGTKEFLQVGAPPWVQRESIRAILTHARQAGLNRQHQAILLAIAEIESGFNPMARAPTSSACGLFQFIKATGKRYALTRENCMDPHLNATAGVQHYLDNFNNRVKKNVRNLTGTEQLIKSFELSYYLHHDGPKSVNPSNKLKAIILDGTPFLLRAHEILAQEQQIQARQPSFSDKLFHQAQDISATASDAIKSLGNLPSALTPK